MPNNLNESWVIHYQYMWELFSDQSTVSLWDYDYPVPDSSQMSLSYRGKDTHV